jgi:hypothetical protein
MAIELGPKFEADVAAAAGITGYDPGSLTIALLNPNGATTLRWTVSMNVDTATLKALVRKYAA